LNYNIENVSLKSNKLTRSVPLSLARLWSIVDGLLPFRLALISFGAITSATTSATTSTIPSAKLCNSSSPIITVRTTLELLSAGIKSECRNPL